jgi:hypothetical protein
MSEGWLSGTTMRGQSPATVQDDLGSSIWEAHRVQGIDWKNHMKMKKNKKGGDAGDMMDSDVMVHLAITLDGGCMAAPHAKGTPPLEGKEK